jgi:type II secretion system protein N
VQPPYDQTLHAEFSDVNLGQVPLFRDFIGNDLYGTAKGTIDLVSLEGRAERTNGHVTIDIDNCAIGDGKKPFKIAALKAAFSNNDELNLPAISLGSVSIDVSVESGVMKFKKIESKGKDIDLELDGLVKLKDKTLDSEMQLGLRFKFNDSFKKKGPTIEGLLLMLDAVPFLHSAKHGDQYSLRVNGTFSGAPQVTPGPPPPAGGQGP